MRKRGVEIDLLITGSSPAAIAAIVGGSMHMTTATSESAWAAQDKSPACSRSPSSRLATRTRCS